MEIEALCLKHPKVIAEIEKLQLPAGYTVCNDPWIYGTDDDTEQRRLFQCYMYIVEGEHADKHSKRYKDGLHEVSKAACCRIRNEEVRVPM